VPAYRESANLAELTERVFSATARAGIEAELIIVDDNSPDDTRKVVETLAKNHPVRLIVRTQERGLSSAVLAGFSQAKYDSFLVMDADLQHPPEMIPDMLQTLQQERCDFTIATRYAKGGEIGKDWPLHRRIVSRVARLIARPLTPLSDPLSGFFGIHRRTWEEADGLDPIGYKIALEVYVKGGCRHPAEVPIRFEARRAGESKLTRAVVGHYIAHLMKLYRYRFPWAMWVAGFASVGLLAAWMYVFLMC